MSGNLLHVFHTFRIDCLAVCLFQRLGNGVIRCRFRKSRQLQLFLRCDFHCFLPGNVEFALRQRTGLIHDHCLCVGQCFQIVTALDQHTVFRSTTDPAEETQRHGNDQCTRTGNNQERQCPIDPAGERLTGDQRRHYCQNEGSNDHAGGVIPCELGDKLFCFRLAGSGFFHQFHNFGSCGLRSRLGDNQFYCTAQIDTATANCVTLCRTDRHGFAGESRRINGGVSFKNGSVQRDFFAGANQNMLTDFHLIYQYRFRLAVPQDSGFVRTEIQQVGHCLTRTSHGNFFEQFANLIEQNDFYSFGILSDCKRRNGGDRHQEILIKYLPVCNVPHRLFQHAEPRHQIHCQKNQQFRPPRQRQQMCDHHSHGKQYRTNNDLDQNFTLLFCHMNRLLFFIMGNTVQCLCSVALT